MKNTTISARAKRNIDWIHKHLFIPEGKMVGQRVQLSSEQVRWMEMIYGSPTRTFICSLPRKNGKTSWSAMILLLHLVGPESVKNGQLYSTALSRDQASVLFSLAAKMVRMSGQLSEYIAIKDSAKMLVCKDLGTSYRALSADASTAMGLSVSFVVHDELGSVRGPKSDLYEALETASAAQENPLSIIISTQSAQDSDLFSTLIDDALQNNDPRVKCILYAVPKNKNPFDKKELAKAQPNWHLMNHEEVFRQMEEAKRMPSRESSFRNLVANQRISTFSPFISKSIWDTCSGDVSDFGKTPVYAGLDLSARTDLTSLVIIGKIEGVWHTKSYFWTPEVGLFERAKKDRQPYDVWVGTGDLLTTPGSTVDYEFIAYELADIFKSLNLKSICYDRWRIDILKKELLEIGLDLPLIECGQGFKDMSPAIDALESELLNARIRHGNHPVLTMCAANAVVTKDPTGINRKLDKHKATGRIDGMVSMDMAFFAASADEAEAPKEYQLFVI
jgi:phage terminase large subunit-like protein